MTARVRPRSLSRWLQTAEDDALQTCTGQHAATLDKIHGCIILNIVMYVFQSHSTKSNCWTNRPLFAVAGKWVQMDYCILPYKQIVGLLLNIGISHIKLASSNTSFNIETKETATFPKPGKDGCYLQASKFCLRATANYLVCLSTIQRVESRLLSTIKVNKTTRKDPTPLKFNIQKLIHLKENTSSRHTSSHHRALRSNTSAVATGPFKVKIPVAHGA